MEGGLCALPRKKIHSEGKERAGSAERDGWRDEEGWRWRGKRKEREGGGVILPHRQLLKAEEKTHYTPTPTPIYS